MFPFEMRSSEIITLKEAETDPKYGKEPSLRSVPELLELGVVNLNKPQGPTSHQVSAFVQNILKIRKAGHSGTLDPKVTGCLPVALGRGTRVVHALLTAGKEYVCIMHLHDEIPKENVLKTAELFVGSIKQLPPVRSAVKRQIRTREIYSLDILEQEERDVLFKVECQAGTYIRKLCTDIGKKLGSAAHMAELVRTRAGPFHIDNSITLQDLRDAFLYYVEGNEKFIRRCILPVEEATAHLRKVWVRDSAVDTLCNGANLANPGLAKAHADIEKDETVAVMTLKDELVALGVAAGSSESFKKEKGIAVETKKVFMQPGIYPKIR